MVLNNMILFSGTLMVSCLRDLEVEEREKEAKGKCSSTFIAVQLYKSESVLIS